MSFGLTSCHSVTSALSPAVWYIASVAARSARSVGDSGLNDGLKHSSAWMSRLMIVLIGSSIVFGNLLSPKYTFQQCIVVPVVVFHMSTAWSYVVPGGNGARSNVAPTSGAGIMGDAVTGNSGSACAVPVRAAAPRAPSVAPPPISAVRLLSCRFIGLVICCSCLIVWCRSRMFRLMGVALIVIVVAGLSGSGC